VLLQLDDVSVGILGVDREAFAACTAARDRFVVQERHAALAQAVDDRRQRALDRDAVVQEAAPGRRVVRRVGHEVEELVADPQRDERPRSLTVRVLVIDGEPEKVAVEVQRRLEIADAKDEMVEATDADHGRIMRRRRARAQAGGRYRCRLRPAPARRAAKGSASRPILPLFRRGSLVEQSPPPGTEGANRHDMTAFLHSIRRLGLAGIGFAAISSIAAVAAAAGFLDPMSLLITVGGALGVTWTTFPHARLAYAWTLVREALVAPLDVEPVIVELKHLGHVHRVDGIPALERAGARARDPFVRLAVALAVEARSEAELREALVGEARRCAADGEAARQVLVTLGKLFPAFGLIGTLIGLVTLMHHLGSADLTAVGPGLGMAVLTTLYGAVLANVVVLPLSAKLYAHLVRRGLVMQMVVEGTLLLHRREYPTRIERALRAYVGAPRPAESNVEPIVTERAA
jgi:chemotaxis protein MotA